MKTIIVEGINCAALIRKILCEKTEAAQKG